MPAIQAHNVTAGYVGRPPVLHGVSLDVADRDLVAIIGPNGSGKTTLLRVLAGVLRPEEGEVRLGGLALSQYGRRRLARELAVVPQMTLPPFAFTVREYVSLGRNPYLPPWASLRAADLEAIRAALRLAHLEDLAAKPVTELSGGELQRATLARALAQEPSVLLLDEPTSFLDPAHSVAILGLIEELNGRGLTVAAVFHDLNLAAAYSARVIALRDGRVFADGPVEEVLRADALEQLYHTPVVVDRGPHGRPRITLLKVTPDHEA